MPLNNVEAKLVSALMKNCRRSDREMAKEIGVSQPTVTRARIRLEKQGIIREYSMIPDFSRLGYELAAFTFVNLKKELNVQKTDEIRENLRHILSREEGSSPFVVLAERGMGLGYTGIIVSFHENYSSYAEFLRYLRSRPHLEMGMDSFVVGLIEGNLYRQLTLSTLAKHLLTIRHRIGRTTRTASSPDFPV